MLKETEDFLKNFPDKWLLTFIVIYVLVTYHISGDTYFQRLGDTLVGGLLTLLIGKRASSDSPTTNVENLRTETVNVAPPGDKENNPDLSAEKAD